MRCPVMAKQSVGSHATDAAGVLNKRIQERAHASTHFEKEGANRILEMV